MSFKLFDHDTAACPRCDQSKFPPPPEGPTGVLDISRRPEVAAYWRARRQYEANLIKDDLGWLAPHALKPLDVSDWSNIRISLERAFDHEEKGCGACSGYENAAPCAIGVALDDARRMLLEHYRQVAAAGPIDDDDEREEG